MVISQGPSGSALLQAFEDRHTTRVTPAMALAVGVSLAVHAAAGLYAYNNKFKPLETPAPSVEESVFVLDPMVARAPPEPSSAAPPIRVHRTPVRAETPQSELPIEAPPPVSASAPEGSSDPSGIFGGGMVIPDLPQTPIPKVIGQPQWVSRPNGAQLARLYPARAARIGMSGEAILSCAVNATGTVRDCIVTAETPSTFGFGAAALKLAQYFKMQPRTEDGQPVDGGQVTIPIRFRFE